MVLFPVIKLFALLTASVPASISAFSLPILKWLLEALILTAHLSRMLFTISFLWLWELVLSTEPVDALAAVLTAFISMHILLDMCSLELVITWNQPDSSDELPEMLNLEHLELEIDME